jgi:hypothetical protein
VTDQSVLGAPMVLLTSDARVRGRVVGSASTAGFVINHNADNTLMTLRYKLKDVRMHAAEEPFKIGDQSFNAGSFIIRAEANPADLRQRLEATIADLGITAHAVERLPEVKTHELSVPRIAIVHTWTNTQNEGWFRIEFDRLQIPYSYISDHVLRDTVDLKSKYDVIIFPPVGGSAQTIVNGIPTRGEPIPWKGSDLTPNMGLSPDTAGDIRGGMGLRGILNLQRFVEEGGLFIPITSMSQIPIDYGITTGVSIQPSERLMARGSIFNASFADRKSPISYGYGESLQIYFNQAPLIQIGGFGGGFGQGGGGGAGAGAGAGQRPSGRGGPGDPDVIQGMPRASQQTGQRRAEDVAAEEARLSPFFTPPDQRPRVVLRFASNERDLLVSGMLAGGSELTGKPAVVDIPVGRGHVVMFATNPMWRHQTQGAFFLLFNAALHYNHLGAGMAEPPVRPTPSSGNDDQ